MSRALVRLGAAAAAFALVGASVVPAAADHTNPGSPLTRFIDLGDEALRSGEGTWTHIKNLAGSTGTDLEFFHRDGALYASAGQLGQATNVSIGQRILRLVGPDGEVNPEWVADHGSASCGDVTNISSTTGLQHDVQTTPRAVNILSPGANPPNGELLIDTVDALGRCHDKDGGGLEFIDVSGIGTAGFEPREVHLTRHTGYSHTVTVDATRPWIVYNNTSDFGTDPDPENPIGLGKAWIDVLDIRTCLGNTGKTLEEKRELCQPKAFRIPFEYEWATQQKSDNTLRQPSACHDITTRPGKVYCAALNATIVFDVTGLTVAQGPAVPAPNDPAGDIKGTPLPCEIKDPVPAAGVSGSGAKVTDCTLGVPNDTALAVAAWEEAGAPAAAGWKYLGHVNHPGRECRAPNGASTCNSNLETRSDEGVAVSHEADPSPDGRWLFVTDERGGGIVPPGATCAPSLDNPYGNGGMHVFDMTKKDAEGRFQYATRADGKKAVYIARNSLPTATFCTIHVIEQIPDEQRIVAAWYTQGVKIIDYEIDEEGKWTFIERASYTLLPNDIWAAETFKITENADGTRTYFMLGTDIGRGIDVFSWTGPKAKAIGTITKQPPPKEQPPAQQPPQERPRRPLPTTGADLGVLLLAATIFPVALLARRRLARR